MRGTTAKRYGYAALFALLAGLLVAFGNPVDHVKADLRADGSDFAISLSVATHAIERYGSRL
ncbi:hypothetical protein [Sphingomonas sp. M1-B02]|uniref:hypothetical protein n=1 Tax=Sphingomonas sp. M1-B02 TaxID=3114300 RepID=UPI0022407183|nr:hypothetical protein [Sphingomonas sp. S6-11]UZK66891.1 hypothetical protein OKW87_03390 [Sphingomonas sp. S6-11]